MQLETSFQDCKETICIWIFNIVLANAAIVKVIDNVLQNAVGEDRQPVEPDIDVAEV